MFKTTLKILGDFSATPPLIHEDFSNIWRLVAGRLDPFSVLSAISSWTKLFEVVLVDFFKKLVVFDSNSKHGSRSYYGKVAASIHGFHYVEFFIWNEFEFTEFDFNPIMSTDTPRPRQTVSMASSVIRLARSFLMSLDGSDGIFGSFWPASSMNCLTLS